MRDAEGGWLVCGCVWGRGRDFPPTVTDPSLPDRELGFAGLTVTRGGVRGRRRRGGGMARGKAARGGGSVRVRRLAVAAAWGCTERSERLVRFPDMTFLFFVKF